MTETDTQTQFMVGSWVVDPGSGRLLRDGEEVKLEPKVMQVLVSLAQQPGAVVSREALEATVWAGTVVGYDAISNCIIKLRKALGDDSRHPQYIETVSKKGYRLIANVSTQVTSAADPAHFLERASHSRFAPGSLILGGLLLIAAVFIYLNLVGTRTENPGNEIARQTTAAETGIPALVVLPFTNLSEDPKQEYFSDGITDDLITALSRIKSVRVVSRQSAYHYKDKTVGLEKVAEDLGVDYVVEGSIQKLDDKIRINVQLSDTSNGHTLWAERFNGNSSSIFETQDSIVQKLIEAMTLTLSSQENKYVMARSTDSFEAYDTFLVGQQASRMRSQEGYDTAVASYRKAIDLDPNYARAYGALAVMQTLGYRNRWTNLSLEDAKDRSLKLAERAVALDQSTPQIYWALGYVHLFRNEFDQAEAATEKAIALSPNYADGYGLLAFISNWRGKANAAETYIKKAIQLNPYHTFDYPWNLGLSYYHQGRYDEAVSKLRDALNRNESVINPRLFLIASYIRLGQQADAEWEVDQINIMRPGTTLSHLATILPFENQELQNAFLADLRQAGIPD
jgi:TolB-like protein/DNA-binding winged helix-turn-helix (wHTH) protein